MTPGLAGSAARIQGRLAAGLLALVLTSALAQTSVPPEVDLSVLEPGVRATLSDARSLFDEHVATAADDEALAEAWGRLGMVYQAHHLQQAARNCYLHAVELAPGVFRWQYYLGYLHQELGEYDQALARYETALKIDPDYGPARLRTGRARLAERNLEGARTDFEAVLEREPNNAAALAGLGQTALSQRRFDQAIDYLKAALQADPAADRLYYPLAMAYRQTGKPDLARQSLEKRGDTEPVVSDPLLGEMARMTRSAQMYLEQGYAASRAGRMQESVEAFRKAVEFNPDDVTARVSLGQGLVLTGDYGAALEQFDRALALDPGHPVAHYRRGTLMEESGDDAAAAAEYAAALQADPGYSQAGLRLGDALMRLGRYEEAAHGYAAIELPGNQQALVRYRQGLAHLAGGDCERAVPVLESAFDLKGDSGEIYQALARVYAICVPTEDPRRSKALELARQLIRARPDEAHAETLAMASAGTGGFARAVEIQETVVASSRTRNDPLTAWRERQLDRYRTGRGADQPWPKEHPVYSPERLGAGPQAVADR